MSHRKPSSDSLDVVVREQGRQLQRAASAEITAEDLIQRGFRSVGATGVLLCRWTPRLRLDALPDLCGNYTRLEVHNDMGPNVRFRFASLIELDTWLTTFEREYPSH